MFCPNCGAQNNDTANVCGKCGYQLKSAGAPKFKGTMLMMNAPPVGAPRPGGPAAAPAGAPPAGAPPAQPPAAAGPPAGAAPGAQPGFAPKPKLKGTMIGVAPPSMGSNAPQGFGAPAPAPVPAPAPAADPMAQAQMPTAPMGTPDAGGYGAPPPAPAMGGHHDVNPLGGTMVADASMIPGGVGQPPPGAGGAPGYGQPPPGFGAAPSPGYGDAPGMPQPGAGYPQGGYGTPGPAPDAIVPGAQFGGPPAAPTPPYTTDPMDAIPGTVGGPNPVVTILLTVCTCGLYYVYMKMKNKKG